MKTKNMELKIKTSDVEKMIDAFATISVNKDNSTVLYNEMIKLVDYPVNILQEFLKCMTLLSNQFTDDDIKTKYNEIIAYVTMRLNFIPNG